MAGRREESARESRRRLLGAAIELVAEVGPRATSVQAVADRAGISRGSIAFHFGSKEGLLVEVVEQAFADAEREYLRHIEEAGTVSLDVLVDAHVAVIGAPCGQIFVRTLPEVMFTEGSLRDAYVRGYERSRAVWVAFLTRLAEDTDDLPDPEALATILFGSGIGVSVMHRLDARTDREADLASLKRLFELAFERARRGD